MKGIKFFALCVFVFSMALASGKEVKAEVAPWHGNLNLFLGQKTLDSGDWEPLDKQFEGGVTFDVKKDGWPISLAFDVLSSVDEDTFQGVDYDGSTIEVDFGVRKTWDTSVKLRPFIGGGLAIVGGEYKASVFGASDSDSSLGYWANAGAYLDLVEHLNLGFEFRYSKAEIELFGLDVEAGGRHLGFLIGYNW